MNLSKELRDKLQRALLLEQILDRVPPISGEEDDGKITELDIQGHREWIAEILDEIGTVLNGLGHSAAEIETFISRAREEVRKRIKNEGK